MEKGYAYTTSYEISYFDVDKNKNLKIHTLIDICNNTSSLHSENYSLGISYLKRLYLGLFKKLSFLKENS